MDESMTKRKVLFKDFPFGWDQYDGPQKPLTDEEKKILSEIDRVFEETFKCPSK
jgi:hypothetical protein